MAIPHLTEDQIRTWSRTQKDQWWLDQVYRGSMPQLTLRSALSGFLLGGILSATGMYIGAKTGITLGVGLTSVILAFALFRILHGMGLGTDFSILENNCTQSIATASGYVVSPLYAGLGAYMLVTGIIPPWWHIMLWMGIVAILGVLVAFPMKRRFINEEQLPFPEGRASGVVLDSLYTGDAGEGMFKARLLGLTALGAATYQAVISDGWMKLLQVKAFGAQMAWTLHERIDTYYYEAAKKFGWAIPNLMGTDLRTLGLRVTLDVAMIGTGGLMGIAIAISCLIGTLVNFVLLAPLMIQWGDIAPRLAPNGTLVPLSRVEIVNQWSLWWGVTMMVVGSIVGLAAKPELFTGAFKSVFGKKNGQGAEAAGGRDILAEIEVPLWLSYVGVPIFGALGIWVTHAFFDVSWLLCAVALPLILVLTLICVNSMALTSWTPTGSLSKITQFSMGAIDSTNPASNLMPATMTAEVATNASNLLSDIKAGYMLGGKPRHQVVGHVIGIFAGVMACVPLFFLLFLHPDANGVRSTANMISDQFAMPAVMQWKGVAELIAKGVKGLPASAIVAMGIAAVVALVMEVTRIVTKGRFKLSSVAIGLGVVLPPESVFAMFAGALLFWVMDLRHKDKQPSTTGRRIWVEGCEPICAGLVSGAALMGIGNAIINVLI